MERGREMNVKMEERIWEFYLIGRKRGKGRIKKGKR